MIREFYSNVSVHEDVCYGHKVIHGVPFKITRDVVSNALDVPIIRTHTYPYSESPHIDVVMGVLCERSVTRGF